MPKVPFSFDFRSQENLGSPVHWRAKRVRAFQSLLSRSVASGLTNMMSVVPFTAVSALEPQAWELRDSGVWAERFGVRYEVRRASARTLNIMLVEIRDRQR